MGETLENWRPTGPCVPSVFQQPWVRNQICLQGAGVFVDTLGLWGLRSGGGATENSCVVRSLGSRITMLHT